MSGANSIVQICYIVSDLEEAVDRWVDTIGAGPFFCQNNLVLPVRYKGDASSLDINVALGQAGAIQLELIEVNSDSPCVYNELIPRGKNGFHHFAVFADDFDAEVMRFDKEGHFVNTQGEYAGTKFAYIDTRATTGCFTELYQDAPGMRTVYRNISNAAKDWDGKDRIRPLASAAN